MRHRVAHRKLGRVTEHRIAMLRNQATALLRHEHLETTVPKAKELRPFVERLITIAKRGVAAGEANGKTLNARRLVMQDLQDRDVVSKLFDTLAPRFAERPGGYTRLLRLGYRKRRQRRSRAGRAGRQRVQPAAPRPKPTPPRRAPSRRPRASAAPARGGRAAARQERRRRRRQPKAPSRRQSAGAGAESTTPRKAGGS